MHSQRNRINFLGHDRKKRRLTFAFVGNLLEYLESREILCAHRPKNLIVSAGAGYETLREGIRCLCNNITDRVFKATSHSTTDRRIQTMRLDTSQVALIRSATVH